jgi:hypothetical protein
MKIKEKSVPKDRMYDGLEPFTGMVTVKRITVDEGCDIVKLAEVKQIYMDFMGKELKGKAMSKKVDGFWQCSTTGKAMKHTDPSKMKKTIKSWKNTSNFSLSGNTVNYARVYVAYDDEDDPSEYTWFIRMMRIQKCPEVDQFWKDKGDK